MKKNRIIFLVTLFLINNAFAYSSSSVHVSFVKNLGTNAYAKVTLIAIGNSGECMPPTQSIKVYYGDNQILYLESARNSQQAICRGNVFVELINNKKMVKTCHYALSSNTLKSLDIISLKQCPTLKNQ